VQRGSCVLALLIALLAIGCGSPTSSAFSYAGVAPDSVGDDGPGTIVIDPPTIELFGAPGLGAATPFSVLGTGASTHLSSLQFNGDTFDVFDTTNPTCMAGICPYGMPGMMLNLTSGTVTCTPSSMGLRTATLTATSNTGAQFTASLNCNTTMVGASVSVPPTVGPITAPVNGTSPATLVVSNGGDSSLMVSIEPDNTPAGMQWNVLECVLSPCPLPVGETLEIDLEFSPTEHGEVNATIAVSAPPALGNPTVQLRGIGLGGKLRVDDPPAPTFRHDFRTIAKNQLVTFQVRMTNVGNDDVEVTPSDPGAPFSVVTDPVTIAEGNEGMFAVSCMSGTAIAAQTKTITLTENAYDQNTQTIEVVCAVANTTVQVTNPLDFQELRVGDPPGMLTVEIDNPPGGGAVTIERIELVGAPPELDLTKPTLPMSLADGGQITAMLELATGAEVVLDNVVLEVEVTEADTVTLELPVTGTVGLPEAVVEPASLNLGTVCVGTPVDGSFTLTNTGSATLRLQRPQMDSTAFVPLYTSPTDYPAGGATLRPDDEAVVGVMPANGMVGMQTGTVTWDVDAPNAPFETTVTLELLMEGTAVSPASLLFGSADIADPPLTQQMITIENCGPDVAMVGYGGVTALAGSAGAWRIDPPTEQRALEPDETMRVRVAFSPSIPGRHEAHLPIAVDGTEQVVVLDGDATGSLPDETSFYACGCSGSADPERGWPILAAFALLVRRRRRRC
jgi:MYXO-CTERM domain-containing protein